VLGCNRREGEYRLLNAYKMHAGLSCRAGWPEAAAKGLAGTSNGAMVGCRKSISFILSVIIMNNFTCLIQIKEVGRRQV